MNRLSLVKILSVFIFMLFIFTACTSNTPVSTEKNQSKNSPDQNSTTEPAATVDAGAKTVKVNIVNFTFDPAVVNINKGDSVIWTNSDSVAHTATGSAFDSGLLEKGTTHKFTFNSADIFDYICTPHPRMKGQIIVK